MTIVEFLLARIAEDESIGRDWKLNRGKVEVHGGGTGYLALASPERVLAECAAKRAIMDEHHPSADPCDAHNASFETIACDTLRHLAAVYEDHPDYRQEWKL